MLQDMQVKIFKALGHPVRLKIIERLSKGELCVCELNEDIDFSQANLSQHLKILRDSNIIGFRKEGLKVFYFILDKHILDLIKTSIKIIEQNIKHMSSSFE